MRALIIVDVQNDFADPSGALYVRDAETAIVFINRLVSGYGFVVATQDWHLINHCSFETWPVHCLAGSFGAALHPDLALTGVHAIVHKGYRSDAECYSGFEDAKGRSTGLDGLLRTAGVDEVDVVGLATDYCVQATAKDACRYGFETRVILAACRGVAPDTTQAAVASMRALGIKIVELT